MQNSQGKKFAIILKRDSSIDAFLWILQFFLRTSCYRTLLVAASEKNEQQQLSEGIGDSCYKIVSIILQELINDFAICKNWNRTVLLVEDVTSSHGFGN